MDTPIIVDKLLLRHLINLCDEKLEEYKDPRIASQIINSEKRDTRTELGKITMCLEKLGIKWSCRYGTLFVKPPVITLNYEKYFEITWPKKLKQFIKELSEGDDDPVRIYDKAQAMAIEYPKKFRGERRPAIFDFFFKSELSPFKELDILRKHVNKLGKIVKKSHAGVIACTDAKTVLHQIQGMLETGHCLGGYFLLRKLLVDVGFAVFSDSLSSRLKTEVVEVDMDELLEKIFQKICEEKWLLCQYTGEYLRIYEPIEIKPCNKVTDFHNFTSIRESLLKDPESIPRYDFRDTFLVQCVDVVSNGNDIFEYEASEREKYKEGEAYVEYSKLSNAIHEITWVEFPPFSSFIEYLGFLHHLRKTSYIIQNAVKGYQKVKKRKNKL